MKSRKEFIQEVEERLGNPLVTISDVKRVLHVAAVIYAEETKCHNLESHQEIQARWVDEKKEYQEEVAKLIKRINELEDSVTDQPIPENNEEWAEAFQKLFPLSSAIPRGPCQLKNFIVSRLEMEKDSARNVYHDSVGKMISEVRNTGAHHFEDSMRKVVNKAKKLDELQTMEWDQLRNIIKDWFERADMGAQTHTIDTLAEALAGLLEIKG